MNLNKDLFNVDILDNCAIKGMNNTSFCLYVNELFTKKKKNIIILTSSLFETNEIYSSLLNYNNKTLLFPMDDFLTSKAIAISPDFKITRMETIIELLGKESHILVTHLMGFLYFLPTCSDFKKRIINLQKGKEYPFDKLVQELDIIGYNRDTFVSKTTDMAVHGYIIDVFPITQDNPIRIEFFGDEIESIRYFDTETQKSIKNVDNITIYPANETFDNNNSTSMIADYLEDPILIIKDFNQIKNLYKETNLQMEEYRSLKDKEFTGKYMHDLSIIDKYHTLYYLTHDSLLNKKSITNILDFKIKEVPKFHENIDNINEFLNVNYGKNIVICLKKYQISSFTKQLQKPYVITNITNIILGKINIISLDIKDGFIYKDFIILSSNDLFDVKKNKCIYKTKFKYSTKIKDLNKLEIGDYIVHNINGIGIYNGIKTLSLNDVKKDYIEVLYKGNDKLYIPVEKIDLISKFSGKDGVIPKINSLNSVEWHKTKLRVQNKVKSIASELLKIYAERELKKGFKFAPDDELQEMFEQEFEYTLTKDQELATRQIKDEMETSHPMDRLLCGDVGFGKTEVAFRAIFKAIMNGKQVIYLCPTTILSMQQYNNAVERFKNYPVNIALLNRFITSKKVNESIEKFNKGTIDLLIGTHKVLNDSIKPKDLGLLVIDEEQRFGVSHKEKIKKYKSNIDVLTLTATPIPRTLQMSLVGIRSMSLITTPPINRYPIETYVVEEDNIIIKNAIYKELSRNGQIFILYNHIDLIEKKMYEIQNLVPEAKIIYAHGQMDRNDIENRMIDFINHDADILLCTTIIETGIDIPNVNTLIILEADHFGLAQLYQIRGRVGRSDKIAYAYMMYKSGKVLGEGAIKRLKAIEEFTELGSGFKIANRDLSIRGAGDILGSEQAGFIDSVGIDLYLKILNNEVRKLKGEDNLLDDENNDDSTLMNFSTHIDDNYVLDDDLKIEIHKMINSIDSYESLIKVKEEIEDRFGKIDYEMEIYMYEEWFEKLAKDVGVIKINETKTSIELIFNSTLTQKINGEKLFIDAYNISNSFKFNYHNKCLGIKLDFIKLPKHYVYYLINLLLKMKEQI